MGAAFDATGSYAFILSLFCALTLIGAVLMLRLGPYRYQVRVQSEGASRCAAATSLNQSQVFRTRNQGVNMPVETLFSQGVMEGRGAYNKHGAIQAAGVASALPLLEKAVRNMELGSGDEPIVIADYGSSQGKNSLAPMRIAIENLANVSARSGPCWSSH